MNKSESSKRDNKLNNVPLSTSGKPYTNKSYEKSVNTRRNKKDEIMKENEEKLAAIRQRIQEKFKS